MPTEFYPLPCLIIDKLSSWQTIKHIHNQILLKASTLIRCEERTCAM